MRDVDIYGLIIITFLLGGVFTSLGWIIRSQNAGDMLNGFDEKKHDKDKVSKIMGGNMIYTGLIIILLGVIGVFLNSKYYNYVTFAQIFVVIVGIIKGTYEVNKNGKIKNK